MEPTLCAALDWLRVKHAAVYFYERQTIIVVTVNGEDLTYTGETIEIAVGHAMRGDKPSNSP